GQGQSVGPGPGADQAQAGAAHAPAAVEGLAVDLHVVEAQPGAGGVDPGGKAVLEGTGGQVAEDVAEVVVGRDTGGQGQAQPAQPALLGAAEGGHVLEALGPRQHRAQRDGQEVAQPVAEEPRVARVGYGGEVVQDV